MKERPILFSAPMVRALLSGSKTQTRRIMKPQPEKCPPDYSRPGHLWPCRIHQTMLHVEKELQNLEGSWEGLAGAACPYGREGDRLWVRETFGRAWHHAQPPFFYRASDENSVGSHPEFDGWKPSIHMPRAASRIMLEIVSVRVERLNDISEADAAAEGAPVHFKSSRDNFCALWQQINGPGSWNANPWVWVVEFKIVEDD